ncbi:MAG: hypothetical protein ACKO7B_12380 [Flavobacteriales bacterium]
MSQTKVKQNTDAVMKDPTKDSDKTPKKKPKVKVTERVVKLMTIAPVKGVIEMSRQREKEGTVKQTAAPKSIVREEMKAPPRQQKTNTPAQILLQDTVMKE